MVVDVIQKIEVHIYNIFTRTTLLLNPTPKVVQKSIVQENVLRSNRRCTTSKAQLGGRIISFDFLAEKQQQASQQWSFE